MKTLDLNVLGVQEMTKQEMQAEYGGSIFTKVWDAVKGFFVGLYERAKITIEDGRGNFAIKESGSMTFQSYSY